MRKLALFVVVSVFAAWLPSCNSGNDEPDLAAPVVSIIESAPTVSTAEVCGSESNRVLEVSADGELRVVVRYTDDAELSQAKFDIHSNFDCHGHGKFEEQNVWQVLEIVDLEGTDVQLERVFTPPVNVRPGNYHFGLLSVDAEGNNAEPVYYDIKVYNAQDTVPPTIVLDNPNNTNNYSQSQPLSISGTVTDNMNMSFGEITVIIYDGSGTEFNVIRNGLGEQTTNEVPFSFEFNIPSTFDAGSCSIRLEVTDGLNNQAILTRDFTVVN